MDEQDQFGQALGWSSRGVSLPSWKPESSSEPWQQDVDDWPSSFRVSSSHGGDGGGGPVWEERDPVLTSGPQDESGFPLSAARFTPIPFLVALFYKAGSKGDQSVIYG